MNKITSFGQQIFSMCFCNLNVPHRIMIFTINEPTAYECYHINFLFTYRIFFIFTYMIQIYPSLNDISQVLRNNFSLCVFAT